jgi:hypothetical protein
MAQLLLHGTNFVNFIGYNAWVGGTGGVEAVQVTEWDEPQAVIGSYLQRYAIQIGIKSIKIGIMSYSPVTNILLEAR